MPGGVIEMIDIGDIPKHKASSFDNELKRTMQRDREIWQSVKDKWKNGGQSNAEIKKRSERKELKKGELIQMKIKIEYWRSQGLSHEEIAKKLECGISKIYRVKAL